MQTVGAYCLYTRAGRENKAAQYVGHYTGLEIIYPYRLLREKRRGKWLDVMRPMIPGYIFLYGLLLPEHLAPLRDMGRLIQDLDGNCRLTGNDGTYASWVYTHRGAFGVSTVMKEGDRIRVVDGPLKDFDGDIIRFDRHKRRVTLSIPFDGREHIIQMSVDEIEPQTSLAAPVPPLDESANPNPDTIHPEIK